MVMGAPILLWVLVAIAVVLICLTQVCLIVVRTSDAALYDALGRPDVFTNNNITVMWRFWRWLFLESYGSLATRRLLLVVSALRVGVPCFLLVVVILALRNL